MFAHTITTLVSKKMGLPWWLSGRGHLPGQDTWV